MRGMVGCGQVGYKAAFDFNDSFTINSLLPDLKIK